MEFMAEMKAGYLAHERSVKEESSTQGVSIQCRLQRIACEFGEGDLLKGVEVLEMIVKVTKNNKIGGVRK